ncbi:MAG: FtsW/RodA/SpoVE family cell cycle protein, partial [Candidatus Woesearchaeota archaeon]|nr:FtsW/RodA/SpoVE family cell cycle protein [Candidatus Woesearchaeota archaeon]
MGVLTNHLKKLDWWLILSAVLIAGFGLASIYSTSLPGNNFFNFEKQIVFFVVGFALMILISFFDYRGLRNNSYLILALYFISLLLLLGLFFFAPEIRGTRGWYKIGFFSLDPVEPAKLVLVILLAKYFSMRHVEMYKFRHIIFSGMYVLLPCILIFLKPDLGGTMLLIAIWVGLLLISGIKIKHFLILFLCFLLIIGLAWNFLLKDYQKDRILSFIFPYNVLGGSWSQTQSKIAIGSGMILGQGVGNGSQVQYGFLPEPHTDFIFSVIAEEWGFLGVSIFFLLYINLIWRTLKIAIESQTNFPRLFASGFAIVLITQFIINVGMNLSMLPVVGIYLPLVSYGGSGLIGTFIGLGILQSIKVRR